jgi:Alr-MurF fusion protein
MEYKISELAKAIGGELSLSRECTISYAFIDSRTILPPEKSIFFAIKGQRNDGHHYIGDLVKSGVKNFVVQQFPEQSIRCKKCNYILVTDTLQAFQKFAQWHREKFDLEVLAITGSNGKTIVKEWIFHLLAGEKSVVRSPKSYNSQVGVPLSVLLIRKTHQLGIFEAGISEPGEMHRLEAVIKPLVGIFTNIGEAHQENFISHSQKIKEKLELFANCNSLIYCCDNHLVDKEIRHYAKAKNLQLFSWSLKKKADLTIPKISVQNSHAIISCTFKDIDYQIEIPFSDKASIENAIHALAYLLTTNSANSQTLERFQTLPIVAMRLEMMHGINQCTLINDTYNSDLTSIKIGLDVLKRQNQHRRKCLVISDIMQSGGNDLELYQSLEKLIRTSGIHKLIGIGPKISVFYPVSNMQTKFFDDTKSFLKSNEIKLFSNEAILIKGARDFKFERISEALQQKSHRTVLEISLDAIQNNLNYFRSLIQPKTKLMAMVKAFSYGSGSFEIASFLEHQRVDYLCVAFADEGVALRKAGIKIPILVMNPEEGTYESIINYSLEPEIFSFRSLEMFINVLEQMNQMNYPIHIKIDTGMKRLGFLPNETERLLNVLKNSTNVIPRSVFSHLVASEDPLSDDFSENQIETFEEIAGRIRKLYNQPIIRHILNSSGIERFQHAQFEMVRLGIGLYGISSKKNNKLQNTSTLKSHITQIKWVEKHEPIGYGRKGILDRDSKIAVLPIGYADGLNRKLGNRVGRAYLNGSFAPIVGNICMDMCMLDITDIEASEGDEVTLFGNEIPVTELADKTGTIPYEILTSISQRVKRVYLH